MIKCKPERNPKQALAMVAVCAVVALVVGYFCVTYETYKWVFQMIFIIALSLGIFFIYRYTMTEMIYTLGSGEFDVIKKVGGKETTACSLNVETGIELVTKSAYKLNVQNGKYGRINKYFNFCQNLRPSVSYVYVTEFNGSTYAIEFEPNDIFANAFCNEIDNARKK